MPPSRLVGDGPETAVHPGGSEQGVAEVGVIAAAVQDADPAIAESTLVLVATGVVEVALPIELRAPG